MPPVGHRKECRFRALPPHYSDAKSSSFIIHSVGIRCCQTSQDTLLNKPSLHAYTRLKKRKEISRYNSHVGLIVVLELLCRLEPLLPQISNTDQHMIYATLYRHFFWLFCHMRSLFAAHLKLVNLHLSPIH